MQLADTFSLLALLVVRKMFYCQRERAKKGVECERACDCSYDNVII
jgi:hypothetical protein